MQKEEEEGEDELDRRSANRVTPAMGSTILGKRVFGEERGGIEVLLKFDADGLRSEGSWKEKGGSDFKIRAHPLPSFHSPPRSTHPTTIIADLRVCIHFVSMSGPSAITSILDTDLYKVSSVLSAKGRRTSEAHTLLICSVVFS